MPGFDHFTGFVSVSDDIHRYRWGLNGWGCKKSFKVRYSLKGSWAYWVVGWGIYEVG